MLIHKYSHKQPVFTSDMARKTPSSKERHTNSHRLPCLPATLRRIVSAAPLKTCGGMAQHMNLVSQGCCRRVLPSNFGIAS